MITFKEFVAEAKRDEPHPHDDIAIDHHKAIHHLLSNEHGENEWDVAHDAHEYVHHVNSTHETHFSPKVTHHLARADVHASASETPDDRKFNHHTDKMNHHLKIAHDHVKAYLKKAGA